MAEQPALRAASQQIVLDVHAHLVPVAGDHLDAFDGVAWDAGAGVMQVDGHAIGIKKLFDPSALLAWMDENQVSQAWISAPPPLYRQQLRGSEAHAWADDINRGLAAIASRSEGRLKALLHLPTQDPAIATLIASQAIALGHCLFSMPTGTGDERTLGGQAFEPLWTVLNQAGAFVFFHPGECADGRLRSFYLTNLLGNPYESSVAIAHLIFAGVLERHPDIAMCFAHGGGLAPMLAGRWERGHETARPGIDSARPAPSRLLRGIYVDCICHSEAAATLAEETMGDSNVLFGSDWPFPMGLIEPHRQLQSYAPDRRKRYLVDNPNRLLARIRKPRGER
jgi:aminocarboxymuconate-semialdehyde decarboxylase